VITGQFTGQGLHCFDYTPPDDGFYEYNANFNKKSQYRRNAVVKTHITHIGDSDFKMKNRRFGNREYKPR
jgi:hypothetical protein